ncbi:uracil phosphoribosyltransferase [Flavobacterium sp. NRK F10]|uniref:Uracil phosphoribosyltransferase n=1 Tax=Flavobacterium sediminis TaxID=2201181 RepID=A0A2U8QU11_9FLAO|nr:MULTISPECIES: uracil phosphoribosyltransferase [Flavobacterium]AWM13677.1 uracil phosphoribosyltransferase [Flavobacterium sediminis]MCO6174804.1 uracil phosphoribosyltransferase [Flavobacterium sp. NRK F10]
MKSFFEAIQSLFVDFLLKPYDALRALELENWWTANTINWIFMIICCVAFVYWMKQLSIFKANSEDEQDTTAHSFLK